jgi:hypothetical protein
MFPTGVDELGIFDDLVDLVLGAVAAHVIFLHDVVQTCPFTHAVDDVLKDLLLALGMVGVAEEHPLEKRLARGLVSDGHQDPPLFGFSGVVDSLLRRERESLTAGKRPGKVCPYGWSRTMTCQ